MFVANTNIGCVGIFDVAASGEPLLYGVNVNKFDALKEIEA